MVALMMITSRSWARSLTWVPAWVRPTPMCRRLTEAMRKFLKNGAALTEPQATAFYVAITRAEQSVAFILDDPTQSSFPLWDPRPAA